MAKITISNWRAVLQDIYYPAIGSIWVAPNGIWKNGFAQNKSKEDCHPSVVGRVYNENRQCWLIPGTSKEHSIGANVFRVKINQTDPDCPVSYFLLKLRMTYNSRDILRLQRGWNGVDALNEQQTEELKMQIKFSFGVNV